MYILEIKHIEETWLAAISPDKDRIHEYRNSLPADLLEQTACETIPIESFPLIVIEYNEERQSPRFEFCTIEVLQDHIEALRQQKVDDEEHIYFRYYFFDEEYFQSVPNENYMRYRQHTMVTNAVLDAPYIISIYHEEIKKYVSNYDIESLDELFEQTKTIYTSRLEKKDLAINGYNSLFWEMNYDYACGKLTDSGIQYLLPMVDTMEALLGEKKWQHRSYALHIALEKACKENSASLASLLQETMEAFEHYLLAQPEETPEIHRLLTMAYKWMIEADHIHATRYWRLAMSEIRKAIVYAPQQASWFLLLELIYIPLNQDENITSAQIEAQKNFIRETNTLESQQGGVMAYRIAHAYQQLREHWEWKKINAIFPEAEALHWAEKSLAYQPQEISRLDLHECAQFYHRIGSVKKRIDFLKKAIACYEQVLKATVDCALEVYYITSLWKEIAEIQMENKEWLSADKAMERAQQIYAQYYEPVQKNPSTYLHYAEFLEYCFFTYKGNIGKPALTELKRIAGEVEFQSEGFLSYPYLLLMKIALYENNETQAILELTKSLILHELCADSVYEGVWEEYKNSDFMQLSRFLHETIEFVREVKENYYYHPELKWKQLQTMTAKELTAYWQKRKTDIRNRPALTID